MLFLSILSYIAFVIHVIFGTLAVAAALYYIAELVEEYTVIAKKVIWWMIICSLSLYIGFALFENFPWSLIICGIAAQITHILIIKTFPYVQLTSPAFISSIILLIINHYLAFQHFARELYQFSEVLAYFTLCLWLVPFSLFVSLTANDNVLPTMGEQTSLLHGNDVVTNYFSQKGQKSGLLSLFNYAKESILPQRNKKSF